jgi:hypothetical protein
MRASRFDNEHADALAGLGIVVFDGWLGQELALAVRRDLALMHEGGLFRPARVGSGARRQRTPQVRRDEFCWLLRRGRRRPLGDLKKAARSELVR